MNRREEMLHERVIKLEDAVSYLMQKDEERIQSSKVLSKEGAQYPSEANKILTGETQNKWRAFPGNNS